MSYPACNVDYFLSFLSLFLFYFIFFHLCCSSLSSSEKCCCPSGEDI